ncbi:J domain-containing protein [Natrarchaeobaculum aegyptiacum]|uniref:J domain-containing protein n=1 Tax=Natrarchaeobaculum aegyptiacum TaxID=745377 RepID=A0A2Z2HW47_9EURY|nr:J domain-containing protein [Natrarchaeobaculum aegyptiacum]ARS91539.1 hypothetical protein B1756_18640 [Natrarchaeobaculum aegyptiacum]
MGETYYDVLEIDPEASRDEIESAYRERVLETHPDHNDAPDASEQFQRVSRAKDVLTDGDERARYDRLGHDAYVRLAEHATGDEHDGNSRSGTDAHTTSRASTTSRSTDDSSARTSASWSGGTTSRTTSSGRTNATGGTYRGSSAKRARTRAATASGSTADGSSGGMGPSASASSGGAVDSTQQTTSSSFRYAVHDWDGQIDFEWTGREVTHSTAVTVGCLWLLYPAFVATSVLPAAPLAVNVILAACTIAIVGYLLTWPRLSAVLFGSWSLLFPIGLAVIDAVSLFSIVGLTALGFAWVPFGYALGLWWALQP